MRDDQPADQPNESAEPDEKSPRGSASKRSIQVATAVLLGVLAFAFVAQASNSDDEDFDNVSSEQLVELLRSLDVSNRRLDNQIEELTATRDELRDANTRTEAATAEARQRADALSILAGTVPARGPGIVITVEQGDQRVSATAILDVIEELRNAGAEVIAVNGTARIVGSSYVVDSDSGIRVDGRSLQPPYQVEAIGDAGQLATTAKMVGGLVETLKQVGADVTVAKEDLITIDALADSKDPEYARPES